MAWLRIIYGLITVRFNLVESSRLMILFSIQATWKKCKSGLDMIHDRRTEGPDNISESLFVYILSVLSISSTPLTFALRIASVCCGFNPEKSWASSTGLTAVSKYKPPTPTPHPHPHPTPSTIAVGTHRKGPSRTEKVTSRINWPIRN